MTVLELVRESGTTFRWGCAPNGGYERSPDTFHLRFDPEAEPVAHAVVKAASFVHNVDPTELSPLGDVVDPDALDDLVRSGTMRSAECIEVSFTYVDLDVTVASDGNIWLSWS